MKDVTKWLSFYYNGTFSEHGKRVAFLLEEWTGIHHIEVSALKKADWSSKHNVHIWTGRSLSTFDFDDLTRLVFLAHDHCIRVEIDVHGPRMLGLSFHPRVRDGSIMVRHPTIEQAVASWRERHDAPADIDAAAPTPKETAP